MLLNSSQVIRENLLQACSCGLLSHQVCITDLDLILAMCQQSKHLLFITSKQILIVNSVIGHVHQKYTLSVQRWAEESYVFDWVVDSFLYYTILYLLK